MQVVDPVVAEQSAQARAAIEALEPSTPERTLSFAGRNWKLPDGRDAPDDVCTFVQAELGLFGVNEFVVLVTDVVDSFVKGEMGVKLGDLFGGRVDMPSTFDASTVNGVVEENMQLIQAFVKAVQMLPDLQADIICLSLGVPRKQRGWFKDCIQEPPYRGGLTVDDGFDILNVFIRQNAKLLSETLMGKARELVETFQLEVLGQEPKQEEETETTATDGFLPATPGGTPSSTSAPTTPETV